MLTEMVTPKALLPFTLGRIGDPAFARKFTFAGNATLTLVSKKTGDRYTFKITEMDKANPSDVKKFFVSVLNGPDNWINYAYIGTIVCSAINDAPCTFMLTRKSQANASTLCYRAFAYYFANLLKHNIPDTLEVWHEGKCGRCGRKLTVPMSIASGIGPECATKM